ADARSIRSLDEADRVRRAEVQPVGDVLTPAHKRIHTLPGPERPAKRPAKAIARRGAVATSDVFTSASLGRSNGILLGLRPVLKHGAEEGNEALVFDCWWNGIPRSFVHAVFCCHL